MTTLGELIGNEKGARNASARTIVEPEVWSIAAEQLVRGAWTLVAMWAEPDQVHLALRDGEEAAIGIMSLDIREGRFPSIGRSHPPARRLERAIHDLHGHVPDGAGDLRPWLDHGRWHGATEAVRYEFLPVEGEGLHQIPVGPVHAGIIEPGHFRFTASGETIVRLEERLGYVHKGIESLLLSSQLDRAAKIAGRASGDSTVAYAIAFAQAVEAAAAADLPPRAAWLRALMLEMERMANHLGDIGAICNDASFVIMHAHCAVLRERVLRCADAAFGHRLMMDKVAPGGVCVDLTDNGRGEIEKLLHEIKRKFPPLVTLYEDTASLQDRTVRTGIAKPEHVRQFGAGGFIGRASGRNFDARRNFRGEPYDKLNFEVPVSDRCDVDARVWIRMREVEQSLSLVEQILSQLPRGDLRAKVAGCSGEGFALVEGFRGDIFAWVRLADDGTVARAHLRDPSWFQWPLLEAAIDGNIVADFPICNKSFNCSYAGHDL